MARPRLILFALTSWLVAASCTYDWNVPPNGDGGAVMGGSAGSPSTGGVPQGGAGGDPAGGSGGTGGVGGADPCAPEPGDDACTACAKMSCCDEFTACLADTDCVCWMNCFVGGGNCMGTCGIPGPVTQQLLLCAAGSCSGSCNVP